MTGKAEKAKAYLLKFTEYEAEITESEERYLELKAKADGLHGTDYTEPRISGNPNSDRIPNWIALADEEARHYWDLKIKALDFRMDTIKKLAELNNGDYYDVLYRRYLCLQTWETIADEIGFSEVHIHRLHRKALEEFADIME